MGFEPKPACSLDGLDSVSRPPIDFHAGPVQLPMMAAAEGNRELVADLEAEPAGLRETQMVGVAGLASADEAALLGHEPQMGLVPQALCLRWPIVLDWRDMKPFPVQARIRQLGGHSRWIIVSKDHLMRPLNPEMKLSLFLNRLRRFQTWIGLEKNCHQR